MPQDDTPTAGTDYSATPRQRAIDAYSNARDNVSDTLSEAPLLALAGGIAAGALIAALLPRTEAETRAIRPTAKRVRKSAEAAFSAAKETGNQRLGDLGLTKEKAGSTIESLFQGLTDAAKASGQAALDAAKNKA